MCSGFPGLLKCENKRPETQQTFMNDSVKNRRHASRVNSTPSRDEREGMLSLLKERKRATLYNFQKRESESGRWMRMKA
ncbi:hypothetical protein TNIN_144471 [Trichonephila inaurata madagascariensis]|uniref:Uncharacterized protein n=1 Tax=Trichonephila inaurata madagascariensis TaxID=2747483 RepID=A0A8X6MA51_9ARAC|nr:hypothetical protein TNIN_144471 [Trichonephila inaurata madagascariensis]